MPLLVWKKPSSAVDGWEYVGERTGFQSPFMLDIGDDQALIFGIEIDDSRSIIYTATDLAESELMNEDEPKSSSELLAIPGLQFFRELAHDQAFVITDDSGDDEAKDYKFMHCCVQLPEIACLLCGEDMTIIELLTHIDIVHENSGEGWPGTSIACFINLIDCIKNAIVVMGLHPQLKVDFENLIAQYEEQITIRVRAN